MNQDITAPTTVRGSPVGGSLSDETAAAALSQHARAALYNARLSAWSAASSGWKPPQADVPSLRHMKSITYAAVSAFYDAFAIHTVATLPGDVSRITTARVALHGLERFGHLYSETTTNAVDRSEPSIEEFPSTARERFVRALGEWKGLLAPDHFDAMARHVDRLLSDQEELDEDSTAPSLSSFDNMLAFLSSCPWNKAPAAGLNRKGLFSVSWTRSHPHTDVTLTFLGEGSIKWYVFGLGRKGSGSAAGTSDRVDLAGILTSLGCDDWMAR